MTFRQYSDVKQFYGDTFETLMRHEAQNMIPLDNIIIGNEGTDKTSWRDPAGWLMAAAADGAGIRLTAVMTPPHNLTLYATDNIIDQDAIECMTNGLLGTCFDIGGVTADRDLALRFAERYSRAKNITFSVRSEMRQYELRSVDPGILISGELRAARESDMSFLPYWAEGFNGDCFGAYQYVGTDADSYRYHIASGKLYILEDGGTPVSMAKAHREMVTVCGIGFVYTPPYFRGKGYAASCVALLSRLVLLRGFKSCALNANLANPTSNSIYQKIGYEPICDSLDIGFDG